MYVLPGDARVNKLFAVQSVLYCDVSKCSVSSHRIIPPNLHIPEIKDSYEHKGVVESACDREGKIMNFLIVQLPPFEFILHYINHL
jgi:hypothetical protein